MNGFNKFMADNGGSYKMNIKYANEINKKDFEKATIESIRRNYLTILMFGYPHIVYTSLRYNEILASGDKKRIKCVAFHDNHRY
jgi:hypothetical protein